jgi:hypothetical protein
MTGCDLVSHGLCAVCALSETFTHALHKESMPLRSAAAEIGIML